MSIQFSDIHNLIRTYQRVLSLDGKDSPARGTQKAGQARDSVTISPEARERLRDAEVPPVPPPQEAEPSSDQALTPGQ
jgi:hypothetical protein